MGCGLIFATAWIAYQASARVRSANKLGIEILALADQVESMRGIIKRQYSRESMRELRANRQNGTTAPDWTKDPDGWRAWKQRELMARATERMK